MEQSQQQKYLVIGLAVVALVLAGVVAWLVLGANSSANPGSPATTNVGGTEQTAQLPEGHPSTTGTAGGATGGTSGGTMGGTTGGTTAAPTDFDPTKATKVPSGSDPKKFVDEYYAAVMKKDYATAFKHLPADKQTGSSADALKEQLEGYGITGYTITSAAAQGDQYTVNADQATSSYGTFSNTWVFVKNGNVWLLQSKAVTGMK